MLQTVNLFFQTFYEHNKTSFQNFFELVRFDFVMDENLKVYLMEINLSPNLTPTHDIEESVANRNEQVVHETLQLVGAGSYTELMSM